MIKQYSNTVGLLLVLFFTFSCGYNNSDSGYSDSGQVGQDFEEVLDNPLYEKSPLPPPSSGNSENEISRKFIKSGRLEIESENLLKDYQSILAYLEKFGGYVEQENENNFDYRKNIFLTVRVPSSSFDSMYALSSSVGRKVTNRSTRIEDVTLRYTDLEASLESSKALEIRYREILKQANSVKDILEIEKSLNSIRAEIDLYESRFRNLSNRISYSTLEIILSENVSVAENPDLGFFNKLVNSFANGWKGLGNFILWLVSVWPFIIILTLVIVFIRRWKKKK